MLIMLCKICIWNTEHWINNLVIPFQTIWVINDYRYQGLECLDYMF